MKRRKREPVSDCKKKYNGINSRNVTLNPRKIL